MALRRSVSKLPKGAGRRFMSHEGTQEEFIATSNMWYKAAIAGTAFACAPYLVFCIYIEATHEHHHKKFWPHMRQRNKAFPWGSYDCDLLDFGCKRAYKNGEPFPPVHEEEH